MKHILRTLSAAVLLLTPALLQAQGAGAAAGPQWWKGNLHTHSLWSDGEDFPEMIAAWYRERGYHFVAFTEHDMLQEGERWVDVNAPDAGWPPRNASAKRALPGYVTRFGTWVEERTDGAQHLVRLRPLSEYRHLFEEEGRFLLLMGEEITDREGAHVNVVEPASAVLPRGGAGPAERIRSNLRAVAVHEDSVGRRMLAFVNHPNFLWALTAEEIAAIPDARFFEVWNGHSMVHNDGDDLRAGTEKIWDVVLSLRAAAGLPLIMGIASDDAHHYRTFSDTVARPGRGWIEVRAERLAAEDLIAAVHAGDFIASTGVRVRDVYCSAGVFAVDVEEDVDASYRISFIGTRRGEPLHGTPVVTPDGEELRTTLRYGPGVGAVLDSEQGPRATYLLDGDELYVRARIVSSRPHVDPTTGSVLGRETAWTQPVTPADCGIQAAQSSVSAGQVTRSTE